jgi:hypothetical protein
VRVGNTIELSVILAKLQNDIERVDFLMMANAVEMQLNGVQELVAFRHEFIECFLQLIIQRIIDMN